MAYLIGQMAIWLIAVAGLCAIAGWFWHAMRSAPHMDALERERDRLRVELLALGLMESGDHAQSGREAGALAARSDVAAARIAELEHALEQARAARDEAHARLAELERAADAARAGGADALQEALARQAALEAEVQRLSAAPRVDASVENARAWRLRYFEQRVKYLEGAAAAAPVAPEPSAIEPAPVDPGPAQEAARLAARVAELEAHIETAAADHDARNALAWRARYLEARVRFLESPEARALRTAAREPTEEERRAAWRTRYLEARLAYVGEGGEARIAALSDEIERLQARLAGLEAGDLAAKAQLGQAQAALDEARAHAAALLQERDALAARLAAEEAERTALAPKADLTRLAWRNRYLDARVRHFEDLLAKASAAPAPAPLIAALDPPEPAPAPLVPQGQEVKPPALPAARGGAPDDLTLIDGIGPKIETTLHALGVYHFEQIAAWTPANIAWVDQYFRFRGRITREEWVEQAKALARGDFAADPRRMLTPEPA